MKKNKLDKAYWEARYETNATRWDIGFPSPCLTRFIDTLTDKHVNILIPGAGNGYEAEYLWNKGFKNTFLIDIAQKPLENFKQRVPDFPIQQILHADFFSLKLSFDIILEQTFFCAISPTLRTSYVTQMQNILNPKGLLVGLLFNFNDKALGPPFGGNTQEYTKLFRPYFKIKQLKPATNSIKEREGKELFFIFEKR